MKPPIRMQVTTYGWLTAEAVIEESAVASVIGNLACQKWEAGEVMGGAVLQRADLPRVWAVTVGDRINPASDVSQYDCVVCGCPIRDHEDGYGRWHGCRGARAEQTRNAAEAAGVHA